MSEEGPAPRQARRYLPIPPKPTSVPLGVNPLATSDRGQTRKPRHDAAIPVQLPPPVRLFVSYYGMGCVAQLPAAPAAQPLAVLGKAGWSVRSPTLSLSPSPPQGAGGALHPAVAQAVQDSRDTVGPSHLFERYAERGAALLCQGDDWAAQAALAVPGRPAAAACGEDRTYLVTLDGALYGSVAPRDGSLPRMEHMVLGGQLVTAIAAGGRTGLAITREQYVYCWGCNRYGQCMRQTDSCDVTKPIRFRTGKVAPLAVDCGGGYAGLVFADGVIGMWGAASLLGVAPVPPGELEPSLGPEFPGCCRKVHHIRLKERARLLRAGPRHAAAVTESGRVVTWGQGRRGCLGHGGEGDEPRPRVVEAMAHRPVTAAGCGEAHTVVLTRDGAVWGWGNAAHGQLGGPFDDAAMRPLPAPILLGTDVAAIDVCCGGRSSAVLLSGGDIIALGGGSGARRLLPQWIAFGISAGPSTLVACAMERQTALCVAGQGPGAFPRVDVARHRLGAAAGGVGFVIVVSDDGTALFAAGRGECGQLGIGDAAKQKPGSPASDVVALQLERVRVPCSTPLRRVACGPDYVLAVGRSGELVGWGSNMRGQLGLPLRTPAAFTPLRINAYEGVEDVACGGTFAVVLLHGGAVCAHGEAQYLGTRAAKHGDTSVQGPTRVHGLSSGVVSVAAGLTHAAALLRDGRIFAWGCGAVGVASVAYAGAPVCVAVPLGPGEIVLRIGAGPKNSFAISSAGRLFVWGDNSYGQCNPGSTGAGEPCGAPVLVAERVLDAAFSLGCAVAAAEDNTFLYVGAVQLASGAAHKVLTATRFMALDGVPPALLGSHGAEQQQRPIGAVTALRCFSGYDFTVVLAELDRPSHVEVCKAVTQFRAALEVRPPVGEI